MVVRSRPYRLPEHKKKVVQAELEAMLEMGVIEEEEAPPWDSRPVSGAGVVHYQLLHRPRSVPTALGPAPLVTVTLSMFCTHTKCGLH